MRIKAVSREVSDYLVDRADAVWNWYMNGSVRFRMAVGVLLAMGLMLLAAWVF